MASFTTRILIREPSTPEDYVRLHTSMQKREFSKTITSDSGTTYELPQAEYNISNKSNRNDVLNLAKEAAKEACPSKTVEILVTESAGRTWSNLREVGK